MLRAHAYWVLIGACNPMVWPMYTFRSVQHVIGAWGQGGSSGRVGSGLDGMMVRGMLQPHPGQLNPQFIAQHQQQFQQQQTPQHQVLQMRQQPVHPGPQQHSHPLLPQHQVPLAWA